MELKSSNDNVEDQTMLCTICEKPLDNEKPDTVVLPTDVCTKCNDFMQYILSNIKPDNEFDTLPKKLNRMAMHIRIINDIKSNHKDDDLVIVNDNWIFKNTPVYDIIDGFESFVYLIERTNLLEDNESPCLYIGKKAFYSKVKVKGKRVIKESDWRTYYGSSEQLSADVKKYGEENFNRYILAFCRTRGDAGYLETKYQVVNRVLQLDESGRKIYYNKNIQGKYFTEPDDYEFGENDLSAYINGVNHDSKTTNKKWINNGNVNKLLIERECKKLVGTRGWVYGRIPKKLKVNDGVNNLYIDPNVDDISQYTAGHLTKRVTNGENNKLIPIHELDDFLKDNKSWYVGFCGNDDMMWATNGNDDIKIKKSQLHLHENYIPGRSNVAVKNKRSIFKDGVFKFVDEHETKQYIEDGWCFKGKLSCVKKYHVTNGVEQKWFLDESSRDEFLSLNKYWRIGQTQRDKFNTHDMVFAIDARTDEKITVSRQQMKDDPYLVGVKSAKIKVKVKNKIVFTGYLGIFALEFDIPTSYIQKALRENNGMITILKGKYKHITDIGYKVIKI